METRIEFRNRLPRCFNFNEATDLFRFFEIEARSFYLRWRFFKRVNEGTKQRWLEKAANPNACLER